MNFSMPSKTVLIVDDEEDIRNLIEGILEDEGYETLKAGTADKALEIIKDKQPDLIILDIWLKDNDQDGIIVLEKTKKIFPHIPVIMISGHGTIETAVSAIQKGAYDFIEKPFKSNRLILMAERALETSRLKQENEYLKQSASVQDELIGKSGAIQSVVQLIEKAAPTNSRILITGEPGTGKDVAARMIHKKSSRAAFPFLSLNCATLNPDRLEVELFGVEEKGENDSVTHGILERANGGTLYLDEVADMPLGTQGKIVRILQNQKMQRINGNQFIDLDVRVIASTNRDLEGEISAGRFREDFYYRLNVVPIHLPSLRTRLDDIPDLLSHLAKEYARQSGLQYRDFSKDMIIALQNYKWSGNLRQLKNVVEWVMIMTPEKEKQIGIDYLPPEFKKNQSAEPEIESHELDLQSFLTLSLKEARENFERDYLQSQIRRFGGNISKTAQFIGMERSALHRKIKNLNLIIQDNAPDEPEYLKSKKRSA